MAKPKVEQQTVPTRITSAEVGERLRRGELFAFVDTRNPQTWGTAQTKLPGAIRVPAEEAEQNLSKILPDRTSITYCTWPNEASSARVAQILREHRWKNVHPLYDGFEAWEKAGGQVAPKPPADGSRKN